MLYYIDILRASIKCKFKIISLSHSPELQFTNTPSYGSRMSWSKTPDSRPI